MRKPHLELLHFQIYSALSLLVRSTSVLWHPMNLDFYLIKNTHVSFVFFPVMGKVLWGMDFWPLKGLVTGRELGVNE